MYYLFLGTNDKFITCSHDKTLILWDAVSHKAKWVETVRSTLTCVAFINSNFAAGSSDGYLYYTDIEERNLVRIKVSDEAISALAFNDTGTQLAIGTKENTIYLCTDTSALPDTFEAVELTGHSSHITHLDFVQSGTTDQGTVIRSNSADHEVLFWNDSDQITG